jgi:hypothetical protein
MTWWERSRSSSERGLNVLAVMNQPRGGLLLPLLLPLLLRLLLLLQLLLLLVVVVVVR